MICGVDRGHELVQGKDGEREVRIKIANHQRRDHWWEIKRSRRGGRRRNRLACVVLGSGHTEHLP